MTKATPSRRFKAPTRKGGVWEDLEKSVSGINAADLPRLSWMRVIAGGAIWATVYNLVWGVAWFAFMRREWREAFAAIKRPLLFSADIWIFWIALTLPIGVAIVAYAANPGRSVSGPKATAYAGITLWLVMTVGMAAWSWENLLSIRIIALDSVVNLVAMLVPAMFARSYGGCSFRGIGAPLSRRSEYASRSGRRAGSKKTRK